LEATFPPHDTVTEPPFWKEAVPHEDEVLKIEKASKILRQNRVSADDRKRYLSNAAQCYVLTHCTKLWLPAIYSSFHAFGFILMLFTTSLRHSAGLRAGRSGFYGSIPGEGWDFFIFTTAPRAALGPTQPPIQGVPGALSLGVKRPWCDADHSPPSSAEVKNAWSYTFTPNTSSRHGA